MQKLVYLFELDSVRKSDAEILIGQQALYDEIVGNGNVVVLTFNQLVDSRGFFSMLDVDGYYDNLIKLFKSDAIRISQFGDVRTISQYLINSLAYERSFIYSGWPLKSTQKRLLALIKRSLMYSDLTELSDYQNGVRTDEEILDLFIEIEAQQPRPTALNVKQCKDIIENLFYLIKTVLRLSSIHTIYVTPKPGDEYKMSLPKYLHHALSLTPADHCDLWQRAKAILLSLKDEYVGVSKRTKPIFDYEHVKGSFDRSDYHHVIKRLYQQAAEKDPSADAAPYQYAEAIVDLCYNYQLEYSICNSSKHYSIREFLSDNAANWVSFASDFFQRLKQSWDIGNPGGRFLLDETNVFDEFQPGDDFPDFAQAVRMLGHTEKASEQPETEGVERYEHALDQQKATRKKSFQSTIRKKVLFSLICFAIALALEVSFEFLQNELDAVLNQWINVDSIIWTLFSVALEVLVILGFTEWLSSGISKRFPDFLPLSDALSEIGSLIKESRIVKRLYQSGCKTYFNPVTAGADLPEARLQGVHIDYVRSDAIKQYMGLQTGSGQYFAESSAYPIADLTGRNPSKDTVVKKLLRLEELFGYHFGITYKSKFNTVVVDPIETADNAEKPYFPYERIIPTSGRDGVVMIPKHGEKYVLLRQFRHAIRAEQYMFPRGFAENGGEPAANAKRELKEELHARNIEVKLLNRVAADSGLVSTQAYVFLAEIGDYAPERGHEGILETVELTADEMNAWIREGKINDGFTLSAWAMLKNSL